MATPADRLKGWIESLSRAWGKQLGEWSAKFVMGGIEGILDVIGKKASAQLKPTVDQLQAASKNPTIKSLLGELQNPTGELAALSGLGLINRMLGGMKANIFEYFTRDITNTLSYSAEFFLPEAGDLINRYRRGLITDKNELYAKMRDHGIDPEQTDLILQASKTLFPSSIVAEAWLRNKDVWGRYWDDVWTIMGLDKRNPDDIKRVLMLQELAYRIPSAQDVIRYAVKEAYRPEIYKAFGQDQEFPTEALADAEHAGVREDHLRKEWIAHWELPGSSDGFDLLHRREITADELDKLLKARDIMPFWREKLKALSWNLPNRVELRMMARYQLISRAQIIELLEYIGLDPRYREITADMMIAQGMLTDLSTRYAKKWINSDEVHQELVAAGLAEDIRERMYKWIVQNVKPERTALERDLTIADIIKGAKKGILTHNEGLAYLGRLGLDPEEAALKMAIEREVVETPATTAVTVRVDTIRRQRRQRSITRDAEIRQLISIGIDTQLAQAYASNDELRLVKPAEVKLPAVIREYQTDDGKINVETIRLSRRQRRISRADEIVALVNLEMSSELAEAIADNDDLRLVKPPETTT